MKKQSDKFLFAIPLIAKDISKNWDHVCRLLSNTLNSLLRQTDPNFTVLLVCHDIPDIPQLADSRVSVLTTNAPLPRDGDEQMIDKGLKKRMAYAHLRTMGGGWLMLVDADDLVSKFLVERVRTVQPKFGFIIEQGWELDCRTGLISHAEKFNRVCGTSAIFYFSQDELPQSMTDQRHTVADNFGSHRDWRETAKSLSRPMESMGYRAVVYTINNTQNHSADNNATGIRRRLLRMLMRSQVPSSKEIDEFGLGPLFAK